MAELKFSKYRLLIILLAGLLCIYASQVLLIVYGVNKRATAGELLLFIVGSIIPTLFDYLLTDSGKNKKILDTRNFFALGWFFVVAGMFLNVFYLAHLVSLLNVFYLAHFVSLLIVLLYSIYCIHLSFRIWNIKPKGEGS